MDMKTTVNEKLSLEIPWSDHNNVPHRDVVVIGFRPNDKPTTLFVSVNGHTVFESAAGRRSYGEAEEDTRPVVGVEMGRLLSVIDIPQGETVVLRTDRGEIPIRTLNTDTFRDRRAELWMPDGTLARGIMVDIEFRR